MSSEWGKFPESMTDSDGFKDFIVQSLEQNTRSHGDLLHSAYQNVLGNYGIQWIVYDAAHRTFRPRMAKRWVPRPVTNKIASVLRPLISTMAGTEPILNYSPVSDKPEDVNTAVVASRIIDIAKEETKAFELRPEMARWLALTGNVWLVSGYDTNIKYGAVPTPLEACVQCGGEFAREEIEEAGGCPECMKKGAIGGPDAENPGGTEGFIPARGANGRVKTTQQPIGAMFSEVASIFEIEYDHESRNFYDSPYKIRVTSKPKRLLQEQFNLDNIGSSPANIINQRYLESLAFIAPTSLQWVYGRFGMDDERALVVEGWIEPCEKFPDGLYGMIVGDQMGGKLKPYAYHKLDGKPDCGIVHFGYENAPGRVAFRTPCDDLIPLQRERNELQSILILHAKRASNAVWFIPDSANVSKTSGEEGMVVRYSALTNTPPPSRQPGLDPPRSIIERMTMLDQEMEAIVGSAEILRGDVPAGVKAYAAIETLEQKANQSMAELKINWANGWGRWADITLGIFKEYGITPRTHTYMGENGMWAMKQFSRADLRGALQIKADPGLNRPTSTIAKRAIFEQGARIGLFNPGDPMEKFRGWEILGMPDMMKDLDMDTQHSAKENDAWLSVFKRQERVPLPIVSPEVDNHIVHIASHRRFCLSDDFQALPQEGKVIVYSHIAMHKSIMAQEMAMQMQSQQGAQKQVGQNEGGMRNRAPSPSEGEQVTAQGGAASQPARANALG